MQQAKAKQILLNEVLSMEGKMALSNISNWKTNDTCAEHDATEERAVKHGANPEKKTVSCAVAMQENKHAACGADAEEVRPAACGAEAPSEQKNLDCSNDCPTHNVN